MSVCCQRALAADDHAMPSAVRFCGPHWTLMPSRMVATNLECQSICNGAWSEEKSVSATALAVAWASPPKARRRVGAKRQVNESQDFGEEEDGHAQGEHEESLLGRGEALEDS